MGPATCSTKLEHLNNYIRVAIQYAEAKTSFYPCSQNQTLSAPDFGRPFMVCTDIPNFSEYPWLITHCSNNAVHRLVADKEQQKMSTMTTEQTEALIQEVLEVYPEKAKKDRAKHLAANDPSVEQ